MSSLRDFRRFMAAFHRGWRRVCPGGLLVLGLALVAPAGAEILIEHRGDSNPTTAGWTSTGPGVMVVTGPEMGDEGGVDAWFVDDDGTGAGSQRHYTFAPSPAQVATGTARGWRLTARVRVAEFPDLPDGGSSIVLSYRDGARRYALRFYADAAGLTIAELEDDVMPEPRISLAEAGYHVFQLEFDPVSATVNVYADGVLARAGYDGVVDAGSAEVAWGSIDDADTGRGHWAIASFELAEPLPACSDGADNDGDTFIDYPEDPGCSDADDELEDPACDDDVDNDGDGLADWDGAGMGSPDPDCVAAPARSTERPTRGLGCIGPDSSITLIGPPPASVEVNSTCSFASSLGQIVTGQGDIFASSRGLPGPDLIESRHEHRITGGALTPTDNLTTDLSPKLTFVIESGSQPTEDIKVTSELFKIGDFTSFLAEVQVTGPGFSATCGIPEGAAECDLVVPGGVYTLEPVLQTGSAAGEGRATLSVGVSHVTRCQNGIDDDLDTFIDLADPDCTTRFDLEEEVFVCSDGMDNDLDGLTDYPADPGCASPTDTSEQNPAIECDDGMDNDADTFTDLADPGCASASQDNESPQCDDGADNDLDTFIDLADPGCGAAFNDSEDPECSDGVDNDSNGATDFPADPGCQSAADPVENAPPFECGDSLDNDADGLTDHPLDPGCTSLLDFSELGSSLEQRRCITRMNTRGARMLSIHLSDARRCLVQAQRDNTDQLGNGGQTKTAQACLTNDVKGRIGRQADRLGTTDALSCLAAPEQLPAFGYAPAATIEAATGDAVVDLMADLFGLDLDPAVAPNDTQRDEARCQSELLKRTRRLVDQLWNTTRRAKRSELKREDGGEPTDASQLSTALLAALAADLDGRIDRRADELADAATSRCSELGGPLGRVFPGACASAATPAALATCMEERARCRFCLSLEAIDALSASCDDFDDGLANGSCF